MFDIGFWEITLIGVVALLVVGPDKFPGLIRSTGYWMGRARQMASSVKQDFDREVSKAEGLKELMEEQKSILDRHELPDLNEMIDLDAPPRPVPASSGAPSLNKTSDEKQPSVTGSATPSTEKQDPSK